MENGFVYDYLGGIEYPGFGSVYFGRIPLVPLGRWLMGVALILFVTGVCLSCRRRVFLLELVRFGERKRWWNAQFLRMLVTGAAGCVCYGLCMKGLDLLLGAKGLPGAEEGLLLLLWAAHMMTLAGFFCLLDLTAFRHTAPAFLFVAEVTTYTVGFYWWSLSKYMFGNWGMYLQSSRIEPVYGFSPAAVLLLEGVLLLGTWRAGALLVSREEVLLQP